MAGLGILVTIVFIARTRVEHHWAHPKDVRGDRQPAADVKTERRMTNWYVLTGEPSSGKTTTIAVTKPWR